MHHLSQESHAAQAIEPGAGSAPTSGQGRHHGRDYEDWGMTEASCSSLPGSGGTGCGQGSQSRLDPASLPIAQALSPCSQRPSLQRCSVPQHKGAAGEMGIASAGLSAPTASWEVSCENSVGGG